MKNHVGISFVYGEFHMDTICKEVAHSCMWVASYIYEIGMFSITFVIVATCCWHSRCRNTWSCQCMVQLQNPIAKPWFFHNEDWIKSMYTKYTIYIFSPAIWVHVYDSWNVTKQKEIEKIMQCSSVISFYLIW
jgi:hypothetical protein